MNMNIGLLSISVIGAVFGIVGMGLGAYNAAILQQTFTSSVAVGYSAWWGTFPVVLASGLGIATALMPTVLENPGYALAVATAAASFICFLLASACSVAVGVLVFLLFTVTKSVNNDDSIIRGIRKTFQVYAASEAFLVLSAIIMFILFLYTTILTCAKCCGTQCDCCGASEHSSAHSESPGCMECGTCADCGECDSKPTKPAAPAAPAAFGVAPRAPSLQLQKVATPALPADWISQVGHLSSCRPPI